MGPGKGIDETVTGRGPNHAPAKKASTCLLDVALVSPEAPSLSASSMLAVSLSSCDAGFGCGVFFCSPNRARMRRALLELAIASTYRKRGKQRGLLRARGVLGFALACLFRLSQRHRIYTAALGLSLIALSAGKVTHTRPLAHTHTHPSSTSPQTRRGGIVLGSRQERTHL